MRGYRSLKVESRLGWVRRIKRELADTTVSVGGVTAKHQFWGIGAEHARLIVKQYLLTRIGGVGLNRAVLSSIGEKSRPISFPLPQIYQAVLSRNGVAVSEWRCSTLWAAYVFLLWGYGVVTILKYLYEGMRCALQPRAGLTAPHAYFIGLAKNNLPQPCSDGRSHDVLSWYSYWDDAPKEVSVLRHGVLEAKTQCVNGKRVEPAKYALPPLSQAKEVVQFGRWAIVAIVGALAAAIRGNWCYAMMLAEAAKAELVRLAPQEQLAREYLFHFSDTIYRPLWTYEAERKGSRITCYFYSTSEEFKLPSGYEPNSTYWKLMNWPLYLAWDSYNADLLRRTVSEEVNVQTVGPIWFASSAKEVPDLPQHSIAVFDIQPIRSSGHFGFSTMADLGYGNPKVPMQFIQDIYAAALGLGGTVVHKRKRHDPRFRKSYRKMLDGLAREGHFISIEPDTAAIRVIERCQGVLSMPFTSTGVLGAHLGKPSAYYDPTGRLQKDDVGAHGVPLLSSQEELRIWLKTVLGDEDRSSSNGNVQPFSLCGKSDTSSPHR